MEAFVWVVGCSVALLVIEIIQRIWLPGEKIPILGIRGRTIHRETGKGGANQLAALSTTCRYPLLSDHLNIVVGDTAQMAAIESSIREKRHEESWTVQRAFLSLMLADFASIRRNQADARAMLREAEEILFNSETPSSHKTKALHESAMRLYALHYFRAGCPGKTSRALQQAELLFGAREWIILLRAENLIVMNGNEEARRELSRLHPTGLIGKARDSMSIPAILLLAESFLREQNFTDLEKSLYGLRDADALQDLDWLMAARLKMELLLHKNDIVAAWHDVARIRQKVSSRPEHYGMARIYHLCCARLHQSEAQFREAQVHLHKAENLSLYRLAQWEVWFLLASLMESEDRLDDANTLWKRLADESGETYFGLVARARRKRNTRRPAPKLSYELRGA